MNFTNNLTQSMPGRPDEDSNSPLIAVQIIFSVLIASVGLVGNILICNAVLNHGKRKVSEYFILNLAITDMAVSLVSIPFDLTELLLHKWPFGAALCKVIYPLQTVLMSVSVLTLLCMSLERHRAITSPLKPRIRSSQAIIAITLTWFISAGLVSPYGMILSYQNYQCSESWPSEHHVKAFTLTVFLLLYAAPLTIIAIAYMMIGQKLFKDSRRFQEVIGDSFRNRQLGRKRAFRNKRIIKLFVIAVLAFAVSMLPTHVMWLWHDFGSGGEWKPFWDVLVFCNLLTYSNSMMNPFIFGSISKRYSGSCWRSFQVLDGGRLLRRSNSFRRSFYKKYKNMSQSRKTSNKSRFSISSSQNESSFLPLSITIAIKTDNDTSKKIVITTSTV